MLPEKWGVQRNICADGSPIIITTMEEQTDEERYIILGNYHFQKWPGDVFFAEAGLQVQWLC